MDVSRNAVSSIASKAYPGKRANRRVPTGRKSGRRAKAFPMYIQSWISRRRVDDQLRISEGEKEERKDRKSYVLKIKELLRDMRGCEIFQTISGFAEGRSCGSDKTAYITHGNVGVGIWPKRSGKSQKKNVYGAWAKK